MIEDRIDVIEPGRNRDRNVVVIPARKDEGADKLRSAMDVTKSSCSQVIPAARKVEKIPVVMRIALLPPPVSPFTVSCRSAFEPYTICAAGFTLAGSTSHIS
jgi:hypothetical protein